MKNSKLLLVFSNVCAFGLEVTVTLVSSQVLKFIFLIWNLFSFVSYILTPSYYVITIILLCFLFLPFFK